MIYGITPGPGVFPGIYRLFSECEQLGLLKCIYLDDIGCVNDSDVALFGAWDGRYAMAIRRNCKAKKKYLHWASPLLQAELAGVEIGYMNMIMTLLKQEVLDGIWVLDKGVYDAYKDIGNVFYAPAPFNADSLSGYRKGVEDREDVSFFTIFHNKQKNVLSQLSGAKQAQAERPFTLYVNGLTPEQTAFVDMIKLKYCDLHFLPQKDYFEWLSLTKLGMQISASEAFSYVTSESLSLGVPVLMAPVVAHNMGMENNTRLIVNDISSVEEIKDCIVDILSADEDEYMFMCRSCRTAIEHTAIKNNREIADLFATKIT